MLDAKTEGIQPVVIDLTAQQMSANAANKACAALLQVVMCTRQGIEVLDFKGTVMNSGLAGTDHEQAVVIHQVLAVIAAQEGRQRASRVRGRH
ncbi:hypothetical protein D3C86_1729240 [compost metagenome]